MISFKEYYINSNIYIVNVYHGARRLKITTFIDYNNYNNSLFLRKKKYRYPSIIPIIDNIQNEQMDTESVGIENT